MGVRKSAVGLVSLSVLSLSLAACGGAVEDEAAKAGVGDDQLIQAAVTGPADDYFRDMDGGLQLSPTERGGRIMWLVWTGGNDKFWNHMVEPTYGSFDLLKIVAPEPTSLNARPHRWKTLGVVNEPCFQVPARRDQKRFFGLWVDERKPGCAADPFEDERRYPGVRQGARGTRFSDGRELPVGSIYGYATGIVGLRLFPNPDFNEAAAKHWGDGSKYYTDSKFYNDKKLIRPYRVGMSCGFCHVGPSPSKPPTDPNAPEWANLSSSVGAQYLWMDRIFYWDWENEHRKKTPSFLYQWLRTFKPGTMDTSLVSTDNINNPRTMNALYDVPARLDMGFRIGQEKLAEGELNNAQFNDIEAVKGNNLLTRLYAKPNDGGKEGTAFTPHVLKDGSDSVGMLGALNRVYLNIGLYSEEWTRHFNPVIGGKTVTPIAIADARAKSPYWRATEKGTPAMALFFLQAAQPDRLATIPEGQSYLTGSPAQLARGREIFADTCARCHSSKGPKPQASASLAQAAGPNYLDRFKAWWKWTQTPDFKQAMRAEVNKPNFLDNNYLSTDARIPVTLLRTNLCSPLATNAIGGNIWDNFSSQSYKNLQPVGWASYNDPFNGDRRRYRLPGGGRGYTRPPSLISLWSTAPFLLNNRVGMFNGDPSIKGRMEAFEDGIRQMLWPERRKMDTVFGNRLGGTIDRTEWGSSVFIPRTYLPVLGPVSEELLQRKLGKGRFDPDGNLWIGPIPKGMPIGALTNLRLRAEEPGEKKVPQLRRVVHFTWNLLQAMADIRKRPPADDAALRERFEPLREDLRALSKCRDLVVNRGHYFGTAQFVNRAGLTEDEQAWIGNEAPLADADKEALIAFLKTF